MHRPPAYERWRVAMITLVVYGTLKRGFRVQSGYRCTCDNGPAALRRELTLLLPRSTPVLNLPGPARSGPAPRFAVARAKHGRSPVSRTTRHTMTYLRS